MSEGRMTAEQTPDIEAVLAEHQRDPRPGITPGGNPRCLCGWTGVGHLHHVAQALAPVLAAAVREARAAELREAADALDLPGTTATGYYSSDHESGYREAERDAEAFLRDRADRIAVDAPEGGA